MNKELRDAIEGLYATFDRYERDPDIDWYLRDWLRFRQHLAAQNFEHFLKQNSHRLAFGRLDNVFWAEERPPARDNERRIVEWAKSSATKDAVAAAADSARTPEEKAALDDSYLRWLP